MQKNKPNLREEEKAGKRLNREMAVITYIIIALFLVMIGYVIYFMIKDSDKVLNNSYNRRQELLAEHVTKGSILSDSGEVLAETRLSKDGEEYRYYPYNGLFAHTVGKVTQGKTGIESSESYTMLTSGINPLLSMVNGMSGKKDPGNNVVTTLNLKLSQVADAALGSHRGAVVVMEPDTGKILAMVSKPTFNPNNLTDEVWNRLTADKGEKSALLNRATQGLYPPGSTFKLYTALEFLRQNNMANSFAFKCSGTIGTGDGQIRCYGGEVHGAVDLKKAFAKSCNSAFCKLGYDLDIASWKRTCESLYYNRTLPLAGMEQSSSRFAVTESTTMGDVMQAAIGQGDTLVTPLQNALLVCASVNDGTLMKPYLIDHIEDYAGVLLEKNEPKVLSNPITKKEANRLKKLMRATVTEGTAKALLYGSYKAGGKTGSAEFQNHSSDSHAWFVGYAGKGGKKLVVSIVVEQAGTGSSYAVPIAKKIFDAYW